MDTLAKIYLAMGAGICGWFLTACLLGWKAPDLGFASGAGAGGAGFYIGGGRSSGGSWGGGK